MSKRSDKLILPGSDATPRCCRVAIGGQAVIVSVASNALYPIRTLALDMPVAARRLVATAKDELKQEFAHCWRQHPTCQRLHQLRGNRRRQDRSATSWKAKRHPYVDSFGCPFLKADKDIIPISTPLFPKPLWH